MTPVTISATGVISQATGTGTINWIGPDHHHPNTTINIAVARF